jgi:hypothetical protein
MKAAADQENGFGENFIQAMDQYQYLYSSTVVSKNMELMKAVPAI